MLEINCLFRHNNAYRNPDGGMIMANGGRVVRMRDSEAATLVATTPVLVERKGDYVFWLHFQGVVIKLLENRTVSVIRAEQVNLNVPLSSPTVCWVQRGHEIEFELPKNLSARKFLVDTSAKTHAYVWIGEERNETILEIDLVHRTVKVWGDELFSRLKGAVGFGRPEPKPQIERPQPFDLSTLPDARQLVAAALEQI